MPLKDTVKDAPTLSSRTFNIAGIATVVHGLDELKPNTKAVSCLYLLHARLDSKEAMAPLASALIADWYKRNTGSDRGLIAVTFDQRNHGSRLITKLANETWRDGNPTHAQDMFSSYHGTSTDVSLLITYLSSYLPDSLKIDSNLVLGVSLGGHAAWLTVLHEPRITAAVVVVGCPDYVALMTHRASKSNLQAWLSTTYAGAGFLGSEAFPQGLVSAVKQYDPAALLLETSPVYNRHAKVSLKDLSGKRILCLSGGADKLVPYAAAAPLHKVIASEKSIHFVDTVFDGVGHDMTPAMLQNAQNFIAETLLALEKVKSRL